MQDPQDDRFVAPQQPITRRTVIRGFGALAGFSSLASLLAACGSDKKSSAPTTLGGATSGTTATGGTTTGGTTPQATTGGSTAPVRGGDLIVDVQTEPQGFNPLAFPNAAYAWLTRQIIDSLYWYDDSGKLAPVLAVGDPETTDGMVWTVKLKEGVKYHNGDPFTAEHVAATYLITSTAPTNAWGARFGDLKNVEAVDPTTVKITLGAPNYLLPEILGMVPILHKDFLSEQTTVMGTGAFVWNELVPGSHLKLVANPDYHLGAPLVDSITFQFVPDPSTRVVNILQGVSSIGMLPSFDTLKKLEDDPDVDVIEVPAAVMMPIHVNVNSEVFKDVKVRQALGFAMDRTRLRDTVFAGQADVFQGGVIPPTLRGFDPELKIFPATADLAKAKSLLAEAGITDPIPFTVDVYNVPNAVASMQVIQQDWAAAGFAPTIQTHDLASFAKILLSKTFDMAVSYEFNGTNWSKLGLSPLGVYTVDNFVNFVNYNNPAFDELLASSRAEPDSDKQDAIWRQANKLVGEAAVNLIPVVPRLVLAKRSNVSGLPLKPLELSFLRLYEVSIG